MTLLAAFALLWLGFTLAVLLRHSATLRALWIEPMLARPVLIVESDDWGPGPETDALALDRIAELFARVRDTEGHPAVMTLGVVLGKPDGAAILGDGCRRYHRNLLDESRFAPIVRAIRQGCSAGVFALQRHGLEHCWPESLLKRASGESALRAWLSDPEARSESLPAALQSRWVDTARLPSRPLPPDAVAAAVSEEAAVFRRIFGEAPAVAVPNTFVWTEAVERAWAKTGVRCVVTCGRQFEGRDAKGELCASSRTIRNGDRSACGLRYVVRDAYFEPIRGHLAEQVWEAVARRSALARPTLLETHRENFIARSDRAEHAFSEMGRALHGVLERHPDLCFMNTQGLADALDEQSSTLLLHGARLRSRAFLRRLQAEPALSRSLKLCGLYLLLPLADCLLRAVMPSPDRGRAAC